MALHIYGQFTQHDEAYLIGDKQSLLALKKAIEMAIESDNNIGACEQYAADGEGYVVVVHAREVPSGTILPYSDGPLSYSREKTIYPYQDIHKIIPWQEIQKMAEENKGE